jgi:hypothetical protein
MADLNQIGTEVVALGRLAGVLGGSGSQVTFQPDWFRDPATSLRAAGPRFGELALIVSEALGPAVRGAPALSTDALWYTVPNPASGLGTPLHLVVAPPLAASGDMGIGVLAPAGFGELAIDAFAYLPLLHYDSSGAAPVVGDPSAPAQIGVSVASTDPQSRFTSDGVSFSGVTAKGTIFLGNQPPTFELDFAGLQGTGQPSDYNHLDDLLSDTVLGWLAALVTGCTPWLQLCVGNAPPIEPGDEPVTVGKILERAGFLEEDDTGAYSVTLAKLKGTDPTDIALNFVFALADGLAGANVPLVPLPGGGIYLAHDEGTGDYGVRAAATVPIEREQTTEGDAPPEVEVSLGSWFSNEKEPETWMQRATKTPAEPGLTVMMLKHQQGQVPEFAPSFALVSAGLNVRGGAGAPLVDIAGFTLNGFEARVTFDSKLDFGFAARLDGIGFPVGPDLEKAESSDSNPMASSLLASGGGADAPESAVNPAFSAEAAYVYGHPPLFEVLDPQGAPTDLIWIPIQRRFGPLSCTRIGAKVDGEELTLLFDGGVKLGGLDIELTELSVGVDLSKPAEASSYEFDLKGLDVSFTAGSLEVSGGLLKRVDDQNNISYDGEALIKTPQISLSAIGSFASLEGGGTSLFVFASLRAPIGGPPFFFVTGLAAGFGYNRSLRLPTQDEVGQFPLLAGLASAEEPSPHDTLASLQEWVTPERGEYWLAAGLQFTSFEIVNTSALLIVEFGNELAIAVVGTSTVRQPQSGDAYVYADIDLEVIFRPDAGTLSASAVLAPSSYVLTPDAHLTGGFAFATWFGGHDHSGDFVFTIGGYHPTFDVPKHYPQEPRLGINWAVASGINVLGEAYFALTPAAGMAGGKLALTLDEDPLHAWLKVQVDALVRWNPFYFEAGASISVGVSFRLDLSFVTVTLSVEIGADLELWGPPVGFRVHVDWYVISFTIEHGDEQPPAALDWDGFKAMLPSKDAKQQPATRPVPAMARTADTAKEAQWLHITPVAGLSRDASVAGVDHWLVRAGDFAVRIGSAVPASSITVENGGGDGKGAEPVSIPGKPVAIRPLNIAPSDYVATQSITLLKLSSDAPGHVASCMVGPSSCVSRPAGCTDPAVDLADWSLDADHAEVPKGMWGDPVPADQQPPPDPTQPTVTGTGGIVIRPRQPAIDNCTPEMQIDAVFADRIVNADEPYGLSISADRLPVGAAPVQAGSFTDIGQIAQDPAAAARGDLYAALQLIGAGPGANEPLDKLAGDPGASFADEPLEGSPMVVGA